MIRLEFWSLICIFQKSCAPININVYGNGGPTKVSFFNKRIFLKKGVSISSEMLFKSTLNVLSLGEDY